VSIGGDEKTTSVLVVTRLSLPAPWPNVCESRCQTSSYFRAAHWVDGKARLDPEDYLVLEENYTLGRIYKQGSGYAWIIYSTLMSGFAQTLGQAKEQLEASYLRGDHV
jgi:hypothetical protein